jgi:hypothetical protein
MPATVRPLRIHGLPAPGESELTASSLRFDWVCSALGGWLVGGIYLDGWAHNHVVTLESFFTPWHAVMYSGFFVFFGFLLLTLTRQRRRGVPWRRVLPAGYGASLLGGFVFAGGGVLDLLWHQAFGIEKNLEAVLSPTHLVLALGVFLLVTGPLRAAWGRPSVGHGRAGRDLLPAILSATYVLALLAFFTQFAHPQVITWSDRDNGLASDAIDQALGISGILIQAALLSGLLLFLLRRWSLPLGAVTLMCGLSSLAISVMRDLYPLVPAAVAAGAMADVLLRLVRPSPARPLAFRTFAFVAPVVYYGLYFLAVWRARGLGWSIHLWVGSIVLAGAVGLLISYLVVPPPLPSDA